MRVEGADAVDDRRQRALVRHLAGRVDGAPRPRCSAQVFVLLILIGFREEVQMTKLYNIKNNDMLYFLLFSVVLIPFQFIADVFTLSAPTRRRR